MMALNGRVLLLNQTYEPLGTISVPRAIIMVLKQTVSVEEWDGDRVLHSAHAEFPVPSVIRRREYINIRSLGHEAAADLHARQVSLPVLRREKGGGRVDFGSHLPALARRRERAGQHRHGLRGVQQPQGEPDAGRGAHASSDHTVGPAREAGESRALPLRGGATRVEKIPLHGRAR
jgi:hypothetical protein